MMMMIDNSRLNIPSRSSYMCSERTLEGFKNFKYLIIVLIELHIKDYGTSNTLEKKYASQIQSDVVTSKIH